jgi:diphthine methyl ester synthase
MLLLIGLGVSPPGSISLEAWEFIQQADVVYLETYTNLGYSVEAFSEFLHKPVQAAPRSLVENDALLQDATDKTIALCVIGDVFSATTHSVLYLECIKQNIPIRLFPNAGIMNSIAVSGLELYKFGQTVSIVYLSEQYSPTSWAAKILGNRAAGLHTLCLLDIKADEGRYMTIPEAILILQANVPELGTIIGCAQVGTRNKIVAGTPEELQEIDWGAQPHSIVIPGTLNAIEEEFVERWKKVN